MKVQFLPITLQGKIAHVMEECGEVQVAIGKAIRFGLDNHHPVTKETNRAAILREMRDLRMAISRLEKVL